MDVGSASRPPHPAQPPDWTSLHWAVWSQDLDSVKDLLRTNPTAVNIVDNHGWTALHLACSSQTSQAWLIHQLAARNLTSTTGGAGATLTRRPGSEDRYATTSYTSSRFAARGDGFAEETVAFLIALDLLHAGADVHAKAKGFLTALHCAASSAWVDHLDALLYFGARLGGAGGDDGESRPRDGCWPGCWAVPGSDADGVPRATEYLRMKYGVVGWSTVCEHSRRCRACPSGRGGVAGYQKPSDGFAAWYRDEFEPDVSRPCLPGSWDAVDAEDATSLLCRLCESMTLGGLRSPSGFLHYPSLIALQASSRCCPLCKFLFRALDRRRDVMTGAQVVLRLGQGSGQGSAAFRLQLSCRCFCPDSEQPDASTEESRDFSRCVGGCRSTLMEDIAFDCFSSHSQAIDIGIMRGQIPGAAATAELSAAIGRKWLDGCLEGHEKCKSPSWSEEENTTALPSRLIDVTHYEESGLVVLVRGSEMTARGRYVALSHRWLPATPDMLPWVLTTENEAERRQGFLATDLPLGIQDAIAATASLGVQYLWVDSLCIQQDAGGDWEVESVKMLDVFSNATVTLFADASENDEFPFLTRRAAGDFQRRHGVTFRIGTDAADSGNKAEKLEITVLQRYSRYHPKPAAKASELFQKEVIDSHLSGRGWIFQEQVISKRRLHFGRHQMFWSCGQITEAEDGTDLVQGVPNWYSWLFSPKYDRRTSLDRRTVATEHKRVWVEHANWATLVENYTRRSLTNKTDNLRALSALAKYFGLIYDDEYVVGSWHNCFRLNLLWCAKPRPAATQQQHSWDSTLNAQTPSWSWLAADGAVDYPHMRADLTAVTEETRLMHVYFQLMDVPAAYPDEQGPFAALPIFCEPLTVYGVLEAATTQPHASSPDPPSEGRREADTRRAGDYRLRLPWFHSQHYDDESQFVLLYTVDSSILLGSMICDRVDEALPAEVMLLHAWQSRGMCPCSACGGAVTPRFDHFVILADAQERRGDRDLPTYRRVGFGWMCSRLDEGGREVQPGEKNMLGLWTRGRQMLQIV